jgi:Ca2+-binding RTX toxin-like protein
MGTTGETRVLLHDDFDRDGELRLEIWAFPTGDPSFYPRTQIRPKLPVASDGVAHLTLDTFNPSNSSSGSPTFYGSEIITKQSYSIESGPLEFEAKARLVTATPGEVGGLFAYHLIDSRNHDEVDFELFDQTGGAAPNGRHVVQTNTYAAEPLGNGHPQQVGTEVDTTNFHVFRIEWRHDRVDWFVDGTLVRRDTAHVPQGAMELHLNLWAPDARWPDAYSDQLEPASNAQDNRIFLFDIDYARVARLATPETEHEPLPGATHNGTLADDALSLTSANDLIATWQGNDTVYGLGGNDTIYGNQGADVIYGNQGVDAIYGGAGGDTLYGGQNNGPPDPAGIMRQGTETISGGDGNDVIYGNYGADLLYGDSGNDAMFGGQDNDTLYGGGGNDSINGNLGNDLLSGGAGNDIFVFGTSSGADTIADFSAFIDFVRVARNVNGSGITDFASMLARTTDTAAGAVIDLGGGNTVMLQGVTKATIFASDYVFF